MSRHDGGRLPSGIQKCIKIFSQKHTIEENDFTVFSILKHCNMYEIKLKPQAAPLRAN